MSADTRRVIAGDVLIDHVEHQVYIDGVRLPWWFTIDGPEVSKVEGVPMHVITLPIYAEGEVTILADDGSKQVHDPVLGNVRQWARNYVRQQFALAYPWMDLP